RAVCDRHAAALRAKLGKRKFAATFANGGALSAEQAIAEALSAEWLTARGETLPALPIPRPAPIEELRIFALGATRVYRGERELASSDWKYNKARELLFYLLCHSSTTKEHIGVAVWPDASPAQLRSNFRVTLYYLRRALGSPEWVLFEEEQYTFNRELAPRYWFDVDAFETDLEAARRFEVKDPTRAIQHLKQAAQLYQGEFMGDWAEGEWYLPRREELQQKYIAGLMLWGQLLFADERYADAAEVYRKAVAQDNYLEAAHRELIRCYARQGDRGQALRQYQSLVNLMREELGASPAPGTQLLYQRLQRGEEV
ncbi:MAG: bacterial transcriptional activator domain-containing protein, partial [Chloroflexota bacterium]|nr:bacterial transcriptional activator domain-containing protein [Chloroflexota bacterium]